MSPENKRKADCKLELATSQWLQVIAELCRSEGLSPNVYYRWSNKFIEVNARRQTGDARGETTADDLEALRAEAAALKKTLDEVVGQAVYKTALRWGDRI